MTQLTSLYLHVPFCLHLCNYCDFYKRKLNAPDQQFEDFHQFLLSSLVRHQELFTDYNLDWGPFETVYLGGGTPSLWGIQGASFFKKNLLFRGLASGAEFTMEIDPGTWTEDMLEAWESIGLNRISVGTQSLDPSFLKILDRVHSLGETIKFLNYLGKKKWNYSLDFLLGVPFSRAKKRNIQHELELLLEHSPKHVSLYILNARSKYPLYENIPDDDYVRDEYLLVSDFLKKHGFHHYEVSNFAIPGYESNHNLRYWRGENVAAFGPTATGFFNLSSDRAIRYKWKVSLGDFEIEELGPEELKIERTYLSLRNSDGLPWIEGFDCVFKSWVQQKYAILENGFIKLTSLGYLMLDSLMDDIFRWEEQRRRS